MMSHKKFRKEKKLTREELGNKISNLMQKNYESKRALQFVLSQEQTRAILLRDLAKLNFDLNMLIEAEIKNSS